jgi:hypothetical protein
VGVCARRAHRIRPTTPPPPHTHTHPSADSWGAAWGESGYIRLARNPAYGPLGQCGVQSQGFFATTAATAGGLPTTSPAPLAGVEGAASRAPSRLELGLGLGLGGATLLLACAACVLVARRKGRCGGGSGGALAARTEAQ